MISFSGDATSRRRCSSIALALILLVAGCRSRDPIRIGIAVGMDGTIAARLAAEKLNADGGIDGRRVELLIDTDAYDSNAERALVSAERFAGDPLVLGVVGHANSAASLAASQVYNARQVVQIAPTTTAPLYSHAGPFSFRLVGSDIHQARYLASQVLAQPSHARIAVAYVNDDYGRALRRLLLTELGAKGATAVFDAPYTEDMRPDPDYQLARSLAHARPDVLVWLGRASQYWVLQPGIHAMLPTVPVLASDGFGGSVLDQDTLDRYAGVRYVRLVDVTGADTTLQSLRRGYMAAGGRALSDQAALTFDAVMLIGEAVKVAGPHRDAIRAWLASLGSVRAPYPGVTGPIAFSSGERPTQYGMETVPTRAEIGQRMAAARGGQ